MAEKKELEVYSFPVFMIDEVIPVLEKEDIVYSNLIKAHTKSNIYLDIYDRRGLDLSHLIGKPAECLIEITNSQFLIKEEKEEYKYVIEGEYLWLRSITKFFPELVEMLEGHQKEDNYEYDEEVFDQKAHELFTQWGIGGCSIDIYTDKPMIKTSDGIFLFNEYQHEDEVDYLELNEAVIIAPKEIILRGIKIHEGEWEPIKISKKENTSSPNEMIIRGGWSVLDPY